MIVGTVLEDLPKALRIGTPVIVWRLRPPGYVQSRPWLGVVSAVPDSNTMYYLVRPLDGRGRFACSLACLFLAPAVHPRPYRMPFGGTA